jgi:hypothetical protein
MALVPGPDPAMKLIIAVGALLHMNIFHPNPYKKLRWKEKLVKEITRIAAKT